MRQWKAQHPQVELIAEAPQHPLAERSLVGVDAVLETAVDQYRREEGQAQDQKVGDALELEAEKGLRKLRVLADRLVDDRLRQVQRQVEKRKGRQRHQQDDDLLLPAVLDDEAENRRFEVGGHRGLRRRLAQLGRT